MSLQGGCWGCSTARSPRCIPSHRQQHRCYEAHFLPKVLLVPNLQVHSLSRLSPGTLLAPPFHGSCLLLSLLVVLAPHSLFQTHPTLGPFISHLCLVVVSVLACLVRFSRWSCLLSPQQQLQLCPHCSSHPGAPSTLSSSTQAPSQPRAAPCPGPHVQPICATSSAPSQGCLSPAVMTQCCPACNRALQRPAPAEG